jgi:hypothetical protein
MQFSKRSGRSGDSPSASSEPPHESVWDDKISMQVEVIIVNAGWLLDINIDYIALRVDCTHHILDILINN